ncbi:hypothetical protein [Streptomyces sp. bgisy032]|uniref:hypothetical protein n=1 Tax=Streptomyces sp. bgisy032 TaxID=3413773 RepID=UPI003D754AEE
MFLFAALPVFALLPSLWGFAVASAVTYAADEVLHARAPAFVRRPGRDRMAPERRVLKEYVLGPDRPASMERFNAAVNALAEKAAAEQAERNTDAGARADGERAGAVVVARVPEPA